MSTQTVKLLLNYPGNPPVAGETDDCNNDGITPGLTPTRNVRPTKLSAHLHHHAQQYGDPQMHKRQLSRLSVCAARATPGLMLLQRQHLAASIW